MTAHLDSREDSRVVISSTYDGPGRCGWLPSSFSALLTVQTLLLAVLGGCVLYFVWHEYLRSSRRKLPPGPRGLPFIGSLLEMRGNPIQRLREFAVEYGPVFTMKVGLTRIFILSEVDIIHEAFVTNGAVFNDRPMFFRSLIGASRNKGMVGLESGPFHRYQKLFSAEIMRVMGIGRTKGERFFAKSAADLCHHLAASHGEPLDARLSVSSFVFYALALLLLGDDSGNQQSVMALRDSPSKLLQQNPAFILASKVLPRYFVDKLMPGRKQLMECFVNILKTRRQKFEENPKAAGCADWESFVDGLVAIQHRCTVEINTRQDGRRTEGDHDLGMDKAWAALAPDAHYSLLFLDFFIVGTEAALGGMLWVLQMLTLHPEWQTRIQRELDEVVDPEETPSLCHKSRLPVTSAVITEVFRFRPTSALGAPHCTTKDTVLRGYFIPKGSVVLSNIYAANNDAKLWTNPDTFDPGRFLDADGKYIVKHRMMTFSAGQRSCAGERWTRSMIFLFTTAIIKRFTLRFPDGEELPDVKGKPGINYFPEDFKMSAVPR